MIQRLFFLVLLCHACSRTIANNDTLEVINLLPNNVNLCFFNSANAQVVTALNPFDYCYVDHVKFLPNALIKDTAKLNQQINWHLNEEIKQEQLVNQIRWQQEQIWEIKQKEKNNNEDRSYQETLDPPPPLCVRSVSFKPLFFANSYLAYLVSYECMFSKNGNEPYSNFYKVFYFNIESGIELKATQVFEPKSALSFAMFLTSCVKNKLELNKASFIETLANNRIVGLEEEGEGEENSQQNLEQEFNNWKQKFVVQTQYLDEVVYMPTPAGLSVLILPYAFGKEAGSWIGFQFMLTNAEVQRLFKNSPLLRIGYRQAPSIAKKLNLFKQRAAIFEGPDFPLTIDPWQVAEPKLKNTSKFVYRNQNELPDSLRLPINIVRYNQWGLPQQFIQMDGKDSILLESYAYNKERQLLSLTMTHENGRHTRSLLLQYDSQYNLRYLEEHNNENTDDASIEKTHYIMDSNLVYEYNEIDFFGSFETIFNQFRVHEINSDGRLLKTRLLNSNFDWEYKYNKMGELIAYYPYHSNLSDYRLYTYDLNHHLVSIESGNQQYSFLIDRNQLGEPTSVRVYNNIYLQNKTTYSYNEDGLMEEMLGKGTDVYTFKYKRE